MVGQPLRDPVTADDLENWTGREAQGRLPRLVRKLIVQTTSELTSIRFPSEESIRKKGWDGIVETSKEHAWVPNGRSGWEVTTRKDVKEAAEENYTKRTDKPLKLKPNKDAFVFVTTHSWPESEEWQERKKDIGPWREVRVYDADSLVDWLEMAPQAELWLVEVLGKRIGKKVIRPHSIEDIVDDYAPLDDWFGSIPVSQVIKQQLTTADRLDLTKPTLVYGQPYIGKTCWAFRQAWEWVKKDNRGGEAFYIDAINPRARTISKLASADSRGPVLFVIDNVHYVHKSLHEWLDPLNAIYKNRGSKEVSILWIGRNEEIGGQLRRKDLPRPEAQPFPVSQVITAYRKALNDRPSWLQIAAAIESHLDPRIAKDPLSLADVVPADAPTDWDNLGRLRKVLQGLRGKLANDDVSRVQGDVSSIPTAYNAYQLLLPMSSITYAVERNYLASLGIEISGAISALVDKGWAVQPQEKEGSVLLTQHPFQIRNILRELQEGGGAGLVRKEISKTYPIAAGAPTLSAAVIVSYWEWLNSRSELSENRINTLGEHAELAGLREILMEALGYVLNYHPGLLIGDTKRQADEWQLKLERKGYPGDEDAYRGILDRHFDHWEGQKSRKKFRPDHIWYEQAMIRYLREEYHEAEEFSDQSIKLGLDLIRRAMDAGSASEEWNLGERALANIWMSGMLKRLARYRCLLRESIDESGAHHHEEMAQLTQEFRNIFHALHEANSVGGTTWNDKYNAALRTISSDWSLSGSWKQIERNKDFEGRLGRHERNAWLHSLDCSCWPALFGLSEKRVPTDVPMPNDHRPGFPPTVDPVGASQIREERVKFMVERIEDRKMEGFDDQIISIVAQTLSMDQIDYVGDFLLFSWRCLPDEDAEIMRLYLEAGIPDVGLNKLPKEACKKLSESGRRQFEFIC